MRIKSRTHSGGRHKEARGNLRCALRKILLPLFWGSAVAVVILGAQSSAQTAAAPPARKPDKPRTSVAGDPSILKDVMVIAFSFPPYGAYTQTSAVIALPGKKVDDPPEALVFYAPNLHPERLPTFAALTRFGDDRCRDSDFDLSSLKNKGMVRIRSHATNKSPIQEELYVATENIGDEPGLSHIYFKLSYVAALEPKITCANF